MISKKLFPLFVIPAFVLLFLSLLSPIPTVMSEEEEKPVPGIVYAIYQNPLYFSESGLGIGALKYMEVPMGPYLVEGKTTEDSTLQEIVQAYMEANPTIEGSLTSEADRVQSIVVHFSGGEFTEKTSFTSFSSFTPFTSDTVTISAVYPDNPLFEGSPTNTPNDKKFMLNSLPSKDKGLFYEKVIQRYFSLDRPAVPDLDVLIDFVAGDGRVVQSWQYKDCEVINYSPYTDSMLSTIKYIKTISDEIRDKTMFDCVGFSFDTTPNESVLDLSPEDYSSYVPVSENDRVQAMLVTVTNDLFEAGVMYDTFQIFTPYTDESDTPFSTSRSGTAG